MSLKEKIYHYVGAKERKSVDLPEFGEKVYFTPISVGEMQIIRAKSQVLVQGQGYGVIPTIDNAAFNIWTIITKAEDEAGNKIFSDADKPILDQMDFYTVSKICNAIHEIESFEKTMEKFKEGADPFSETSSPSLIEKNVSSETSPT